jgi:hypothetical protein
MYFTLAGDCVFGWGDFMFQSQKYDPPSVEECCLTLVVQQALRNKPQVGWLSSTATNPRDLDWYCPWPGALGRQFATQWPAWYCTFLKCTTLAAGQCLSAVYAACIGRAPEPVPNRLRCMHGPRHAVPSRGAHVHVCNWYVPSPGRRVHVCRWVVVDKGPY